MSIHMREFISNKLVRMQHCDAGGVIFTPQYFNIFTEVLEDWFGQELKFSFSSMLGPEKSGSPAMRIAARFMRPSKLGDILSVKLFVERLRQRSAVIQMHAFSEKQSRCSATFHLGFIKLPNFRLYNWPSEVYERMQLFVAK